MNKQKPSREYDGASRGELDLDRDRALEQEAMARAQVCPAPGLPGFTFRDLANALVVGAWRNGFIETLHAGKWSPLLSDPSLSRITNDEMKKLNIEASAQLAHLLYLFFESPKEFLPRILRLHAYADGWDRQALRFDLPEVADENPKCLSCHESIISREWRFCPLCGTSTGETP